MAVRTVADTYIRVINASNTGSLTRMVRIFFPRIERKSERLDGSVEEQVEQLVQRLEEIVQLWASFPIR